MDKAQMDYMSMLRVCACVCVSRSVVSDSAILWTVAHQAPLSMEISSKNIEVGYCARLHGIFPT